MMQVCGMQFEKNLSFDNHAPLAQLKIRVEELILENKLLQQQLDAYRVTGSGTINVANKEGLL